MCRFLLVKLKTPDYPKKYLESFASMSKKSRAYDGEWQGDGWGISWLSKDCWKTKKSLLPVWEQKDTFSDFPKTSTFAVHARSSLLSSQKGVIEYNQPFVDEPYIFVFNGFLKGISLTKLPGEIGAQKIWFLLRKLLERMNPKEALSRMKDTLLKNCREVQALNIGLSDKKNIYVLNYFSKYKDYYQMRYLNNSFGKIICSENLGEVFNWKILPHNTISQL